MNSLAGSLKLRLSTGLAAQGYNQGVTIATQLISVPVLISAWGVEQYGVWLLISAIPAYLSLADLGFAQVGGSDMTMRLARGDREGALTTYQSTFAMNCALGLLCFASITGFALSPLSRDLIGDAHASQGQWAIIALSAYMLMVLLRGVLGAGLRSTGQYSLHVALGATMRLADALIVLGVALAGGGIFNAALGMLVGATAVMLVAVLWFQRRYPWLKLGFSNSSAASVRELLSPSLHYVGYTLGNLVSIQGSTIVIGAVLGPVAVALTSTLRTLARTGVTVANMLSMTLQIEYATLFGKSAFGRFVRLFRWHALTIGALMIAYVVLMLTLGPKVYDLWTHGKFGEPSALLTWLTIATACDIAWTALQTPSIAVNRMRITGRTFFLASCLAIVALGLLSPAYGVIVFGWVSLTVSVCMVLAAALETRILARSLNVRAA